jgi:quercetin dioxygenase-like cupin family protein
MIRTGDVLHNPVTGELIRFVKAAADTNAEYVVVDVVVEPNGCVAAAHCHPYQTETFEVLEGEVTFKVGGKRIVAKAGETLAVAPAQRTSSGTPAPPTPASVARCARRSSSSS